MYLRIFQNYPLNVCRLKDDGQRQSSLEVNHSGAFSRPEIGVDPVSLSLLKVCFHPSRSFHTVQPFFFPGHHDRERHFFEVQDINGSWNSRQILYRSRCYLNIYGTIYSVVWYEKLINKYILNGVFLYWNLFLVSKMLISGSYSTL